MAEREKYRRNPEYHRESVRKSHWKLRKEVMTLLGGKCVICGLTDLRLLNLNHKNGGGTKDRGKRIKVYREILSGVRGKNEYDVRCFNCNILYDYERGIRKVPQGLDITLI
ncbi:hypothetical protein ES708_03699 [subsurface metagenome]